MNCNISDYLKTFIIKNGSVPISENVVHPYSLKSFIIPKLASSSVFKEWNEGNILVDHDQNPIVIFHGTRYPDEIQQWNLEQAMDGIHFGSYKMGNNFASYRFDEFVTKIDGVATRKHNSIKENAVIYPVVVKTKRPLIFPFDMRQWTFNHVRAFMLSYFQSIV